MKNLILSTLAAAFVLTGMSSSFAASKQTLAADTFGRGNSTGPNSGRPDNTTVPMSGAEWWQNKGNADDMGVIYHR